MIVYAYSQAMQGPDARFTFTLQKGQETYEAAVAGDDGDPLVRWLGHIATRLQRQGKLQPKSTSEPRLNGECEGEFTFRLHVRQVRLSTPESTRGSSEQLTSVAQKIGKTEPKHIGEEWAASH